MSVHPNTGNIIPVIFRPNAFPLAGSPLVITTIMPHQGVMSAFISQLLFQGYSAGFTLFNRNISVETPNLSRHPLYLSASVLLLGCVGTMPLYVVKKLKLRGPSSQSFIRVLPPPLCALLGGLNVLLMRTSEMDSGIQVMDGAGNVVGVSPTAGKKAVKETAMSRAFLCGVTALFPLLVRSPPHTHRNPRIVTILKLVIGALTFVVMTPISFGLFPLQGKIQRDDLEDEIKRKTSDSELFYHRGV